MSVIITVGPTGAAASKSNNPALPTSPEEIAAEAAAAYEAGAAVVSIHLRDEQQRPTADLDIARRTMDLIREQSPILIQLSTGVAPDAPLEERAKLLELRPRMATLSPCSMSFGEGEFRNPPDFVRRMAGRMRELDIKPSRSTTAVTSTRRSGCSRRACSPNPCSSGSCSVSAVASRPRPRPC
jgi:3-keto-5-aminohexanoate cleavage enzyme